MRLACPRGLITGTAAYIVTPDGARRALHATLPVRATVDKQLGWESPHLMWLAPDQDHASLAAVMALRRSVNGIGSMRPETSAISSKSDSIKALPEMPSR